MHAMETYIVRFYRYQKKDLEPNEVLGVVEIVGDNDMQYSFKATEEIPKILELLQDSLRDH